jgi:hypothetical protein
LLVCFHLFDGFVHIVLHLCVVHLFVFSFLLYLLLLLLWPGTPFGRFN